MSKFFGLITACLTLVSFSGQVTAAQTDATCFRHDAYLLPKTLNIKGVAPCDFIGALYIYGIKGTTFMRGGESIPDEYQYYYFARTYLAQIKNYKTPTEKEKATLGLLLAMLLTALSDQEISISDKRKNTYKAHFLRELYNKNLRADGSVVGMVHAYMGIHAAELGFETWGELSCFIRHDIPTLKYEQIMNSETYLECKKKLD